MLDDLFAADNAAAARDLIANPSRRAPEPPKFSAWSLVTAVPRGAGEAAAQVLGSAADIANAFRYMRDATPEQRKQMDRGGIPAAQFSSDLGDSLRDRGREFRPDPQSASTAEQVLYGFARGAAKIIPSAMVAGPLGVGLAGAEEAFSASDDLRRQGVDLNTRSKAAVVQGAGLALAALPAAGTTLAGTAALYAAGGPGGFIAQQALTREILSGAGYNDIGKGYDPFDPVGLAVSSLIPAAFAAHGYRANKIAAAVRSLPDLPPRDTSAPVDTAAAPIPSELSPVAAAVRAYPDEVVDAARVALLAERRAAANPGRADDLRAMDQHEAAMTRAEDQLARGEPVQVADLVNVSDDSIFEARLQRKISGDFGAAVDEYSRLEDAGGGKILNTDTARELSPDYLADRTRSAAVHEPASQFIKDLYAQKLTEAPKPGELPSVLFMAGGTGAGKTSAIKALPSVSKLADQAQIIYDTNMNGYESSKKKIEQALAADKSVTIVMVARDPEDALVNGALPRAEGQRKKFGSGRTVPIKEHINTHLGAVDTVRRLAKEYADNPLVAIRIVDNSLGKGNQVERDLSWLDALRYNDVERRVSAALENERETGRISPETYAGFSGRPAQGVDAGNAGPARGVQPPDRPGDGAGAAQGNGRQEVGRQAEAAANSARLAQITQDFPDMPVMMDGMGAPMRLSDFIAAAKAEADEIAADAPLMQIAAECALTFGV